MSKTYMHGLAEGYEAHTVSKEYLMNKLEIFANKLEQLAQQPTVSGEKILLLMEEYGHHFGWTVTA